MYTFRKIFTSCKLIFVNYCALTVLFTPVFFSVAHLLVARYHCRYTVLALCRLPLKCDGTRTETSFRLSAKRTSPFKSAGASVQSTTGSRGVRISGSNAGYNLFRGSVKGTGHPLHSPVSPSLPLPCVTVCHQTSPGLYHLLQHAKTVRFVPVFMCFV